MRNGIPRIVLLFFFSAVFAVAQAPSPITVLWPSDGKPHLKLTFGKLQQRGVVDGQNIFNWEVAVQNSSDESMPRAVFTVHISDKSGHRIGRAVLLLPQTPPYRTQKTSIQFSAAGIPAAVSLVAGKTIALRVISIPPGAALKVDGSDEGVTPKVVDFTIGSHTLEFSKEGYAPGSTTLEVNADELPGGSISFELGGLSADTIELRDGTVLLGNVLSMSLTSVNISVNGKEQVLERNQVKKMMLVERQVTQQPATAPPVQSSPKQ